MYGFLNDAEPILKQIVAPRLALLLRKRIAELAGVSLDEMHSMIKLPETNRRPAKTAPRQSRTTHVITAQVCVDATDAAATGSGNRY